jgi:hypothetical protein
MVLADNEPELLSGRHVEALDALGRRSRCHP